MSTEEGLPTGRFARTCIERLRDRCAYLQAKRDRLIAQERIHSYEDEEIEALQWAIPVLEAEWASIARLRRSVRPEISENGRRHALRPPYRPGIDTEPHEWSCKCGTRLDYGGKDRTVALQVLQAHRDTLQLVSS